MHVANVFDHCAFSYETITFLLTSNGVQFIETLVAWIHALLGVRYITITAYYL